MNRPNSDRAGAPGERKLRAVRVGALAAAAGLILAGIANGGMWDVLYKAVTICTECIGLG